MINVRLSASVFLFADDSSILVNVTRDLQEAYPEFSMFSAEWVFIATYDNVPSFHELGGPGVRYTCILLLLTQFIKKYLWI